MVAVVEARALTTSYGRARTRGIVDVNLAVAPGQVMGLVGANGAGKTTLMRTMLDFIHPDSGSLRLHGLDSRTGSVAIRRRTTYLPGELVLPARLTGRGVVARYLAARRDVGAERVTALAGDLDLDLDRAVGDLSKGNRQKLGLLLAFAPPADLLVLDEPTSGLDPLLQRRFAELVADATARGAAVLLSSHVMGEVEQVADSVALMREGRIVTVEPLAALLARGIRRGRARPAEPAGAAALAHDLRTTPGLADVLVDGSDAAPLVTFAVHGDVNPMLAVLARHRLDTFDLAHVDLEDAFFRAEGRGSAP